jgi:hypothetical protein
MALKLLAVVCLLSGGWATSGDATATSGLVAAAVPGLYTFTLRDDPTDNVLSDGLGSYVSGTDSTCGFWFTHVPCGRDLIVTGCLTPFQPHNQFLLRINPVGKCVNQIKIGQTVGAWGAISFTQNGCTSLGCEVDRLFADNVVPHQVTITRTGKNTWVLGATNGVFEHRLDDSTCCDMCFVREPCPLTFQMTITRN